MMRCGARRLDHVADRCASVASLSQATYSIGVLEVVLALFEASGFPEHFNHPVFIRSEDQHEWHESMGKVGGGCDRFDAGD
jgi:hypothetical protein